MRHLALSSTMPRCLVVEDQVLIAMALEARLDEAGFEVAGLFTACAEALAWLETHRPEIAVLDYKLKDGCCLELARALHRQGVPFLIYSGLPCPPEWACEFHDVPWLEKPTSRSDLLEALGRLLPGRTDCSHGNSCLVTVGP